MKHRRRILAMLLTLVLAVGMLAAPVSAAAPEGAMAVYYVSPEGSDAGDGRSAQTAFATLERARDEVRRININMTGDIVVYLLDGVWELSETLCFDERDSGTNGFYVRYQAAPGAQPIVSGGRRLNTAWTVAEEVNWLRGGLVAYKTPLVRDDKLRAIYVNDQRASLTRKTLQPKRAAGTYTVTAGQADWAWVGGSQSAGNVFNSADLPANTRNPQNIELESGSTWVKAMVCAASLQSIGNGETQVNFQMPYGAIAQSLLWNCAYKPTGSNDVTNVYEWLSKAGEFYFDQAGSTLYYIPRAGEDMGSAEVVVPELDQLIDVRGSAPMERYAENIVFDGIKFAYTDWNLVEVAGSHGNCTQQGCTILTKYSGQWHNDLYRAYDIPPAAIQVNTAKNVRILNGEVSNTGYLGVHLENDVWDCDVTGNFIARTGGAGVVVGHPQHIYENDTPAHRVGNGADCTKEKFPAGTESVPKHIRITNNYLLENCYFFPGNSPITSFYTYDMQVLHNFIYKCSYSGMSIGWGWCEYDGTSSSQLPGKPTVTSRANTVSGNRVEEICSILQDAGGIYTLGQQGNEDWTDVTVMNNNYINCSRIPQQADGSRMVNGFHPDEGSAYILLDGNVVTNIIRNVYELNNWQRKHDVIVTNGFSNTDRSETTAPNCSLEQYVDADCIWPLLGYKTVLDSGLENEYVHMIGKDVIADTEYELASNVRMEASSTLPRRGLLRAEDTVWIAPAGTVRFAEGPTMTRAAGNEKGIALPETAGTYKLYVAYADGTVSGASKNTVYVGEARSVANVADGMRYSVSQTKPLALELNTDSYRFTLNGEAVSSGKKISAAGEWTLTASMIGSEEPPAQFRFSTYVTEANRLLPKSVTVAAGETVQLSERLGDPTLTLWLASQSASAFAPDRTMSAAPGDRLAMTAPLAEGVYDLSVVDAQGNIRNRSDATVRVVKGADYVAADQVESGKQYVVVSQGYAMSAAVAEPIAPSGETTLAAAVVSEQDGRIASDVSRDLIWTATEAEGGCYLTSGGRYLRVNGEGSLLADGSGPDGNCLWTLERRGEAGEYTLKNGEHVLQWKEKGFTAPAGADQAFRFYEVVPVKGLDDVDFTDPACLDRIEIVNPSASRVSDRGLYMVTTKDGFEPANDQLSGAAAATPKDLVLVDVEGDWSATLRFAFDPTANNGYYQFFGFYAMEDYANCAGIRGGDGAIQDFLRLGGSITAETKSVGPGLSEQGTYWFRIVKQGSSYTCFRSSDGEAFTQLFAYPDTGIEAKKLAIDAYTGMTEGYTFYLERLSLESDGTPAQQGCTHAYDAAVTPPYCTGAGYTVYACRNCTDRYVADVKAALGHDFADGVCTRCGEADPDYVPPIDRAVLQAAIAAAEQLDTAGYTDESVAAFTKALADAKGALEADTQAAVDKAAADLDAAVKALVEKPNEPPFRFDDVRDEGQYFFAPVYWAVDRGVTKGTSETQFSPDAGCTRAQAVTFLWRAAGQPEPGRTDSPFEDVKEGTYYYKAVLWAVEKGVTTGTSATTFRPDATCTRAQIVTFLWRAQDQPEPWNSSNPFSDVKAEDYFCKAVLWALEKGVTRGTSDTRFSPNATCTRAQIVTFLYRAMQ